MTLFFYDTETTGLPLWHEPSGNSDQPHMVSLAAQLCEDDGKTLASLNLIVRPNGWDIPQEVVDVHGMDLAFATRCGVDEELATRLLVDLADHADLRIGHGQNFDARIVRIALKRYGMGEYADDHWKVMPAACTMNLARPIVNLPPTDKMMAAGRKTPKSPTMTEAYEFFLGKPMEGAHSAMYDVLACKAVYFAIKNRSAAA